MSNSAIDKEISKVKGLIQGLEILNYKRDKLVKSMLEVPELRGLRDFRAFLFSNEIDSLKTGLQSSKSINLEELDKIISQLTDMKKDLKYVAVNSFVNQFENVVRRRIIGDKGVYSQVLSETYNVYSKKLDTVKSVSRFYIEERRFYPRTLLSLFYASFIVALLNKFIQESVDYVEINKIASEFNYDFILSFSFTESKSHVVHEFKGKNNPVISLVLDLVNNPDKLKRRFKNMKQWVSSKGYPFDVRYPVVRSRELFGDNWYSIILIIFREGSIRIIPELTATIGFLSEPRRIASPLYIEITVSKDAEKLLIISNQSLEQIEKKDKLRETFEEVLSQLLGEDITIEHLMSLKPEIYDTSSDVFVEELALALKGRNDYEVKEVLERFENKLKTLMKKVLEDENTSMPFTHREKLKVFTESMELAEFLLEYKLGKTTILKLGLQLSPFIDEILPEVKTDFIASNINSITRTLEDLRGHLGEATPIEENIIISFLGKTGSQHSRISFDSRGTISFHKMNRELVTELSLLLWEVKNKWNMGQENQSSS